MGFFSWVGGKLGSGAALQKEVNAEAQKSERAAKELLKLAKHMQGLMKKLSKVRKPGASYDIMDQKLRSKVQSVTDEFSTERRILELQDRILDLYIVYNTEMGKLMSFIRAEHKFAREASETEGAKIVMALEKERKEMRAFMERESEKKLKAALDRADRDYENQVDNMVEKSGLAK